MTPENVTLIRDSRALIRESMHVKRAAGWADIANQLTTALEKSEEIRESLEIKVQELAAQLERSQGLQRKAQPMPYVDEDY